MTASTSVLAAGRVRFTQALPKRTTDAIAALSLGTHDRVVFELPDNPFRFADDQSVIFKTTDRRAIALIGRVGGTDLAFADYAGGFGAELSRAGEAAMVAFLKEVIAVHFGTDAPQSIPRFEAIRWSREPWIMGGISAAAPGAAASRRILAEPVHDRIFFAGEAVHESMWGTFTGAWLSGERAADAALRRVGGATSAPSGKAKAIPGSRKAPAD
jgi:monoamine oxidase